MAVVVVVLILLVMVLQMAIWRSVVYRSGEVYHAVIAAQSKLIELRSAHDALHASHEQLMQVRSIHPTRGPVK